MDAYGIEKMLNILGYDAFPPPTESVKTERKQMVGAAVGASVVGRSIQNNSDSATDIKILYRTTYII